MNVTIQMKYMTDGGRAQQSGTFPLKSKKPEEVAFDWMQEIKRKVTYQELISVILDEEKDLTEKVLEMEKAPLN
jgi:hypothetical protein